MEPSQTVVIPVTMTGRLVLAMEEWGMREGLSIDQAVQIACTMHLIKMKILPPRGGEMESAINQYLERRRERKRSEEAYHQRERSPVEVEGHPEKSGGCDREP